MQPPQPPFHPEFPGYGAPPPPPPRRSGALLVVTAVVLVLLLAGSITFAALQFREPPPRPQAAPTPTSAPAKPGKPEWQPYVDAARSFAITVLSVSAATVDADVEKILAGSTGAFRDDFAKQIDDFKKVTRTADASTTATVNEAALEKFSVDSAVVLVATTSTVSNNTNRNQEPRHWRLQMTMEKVGDDYKASKVEFVE